jgi:hypothetical protein
LIVLRNRSTSHQKKQLSSETMPAQLSKHQPPKGDHLTPHGALERDGKW